MGKRSATRRDLERSVEEKKDEGTELTDDGSSDAKVLHNNLVSADGSNSDGILDGVCESKKGNEAKGDQRRARRSTSESRTELRRERTAHDGGNGGEELGVESGVGSDLRDKRKEYQDSLRGRLGGGEKGRTWIASCLGIWLVQTAVAMALPTEFPISAEKEENKGRRSQQTHRNEATRETN